ncbi:SMI1/KNR4 family protein [Chitinophaga sp. OAE865]|uniref:SMI1/KNR4 family protein n=1 Tax=Chitinophaga sp. OAE865 TaxID=2817898 RepID=UPI001AE98F45
MNSQTKELLKQVISNAKPVSLNEIEAFEKKQGLIFPNDLKNALVEIHAGKGEVGKNGYLDLFPINELEEMNEAYEFVMEQIPDYYLFAKDAADTGYAFHKQKHSYHAFGLMSNFEFDTLDNYGSTFDEFISSLDTEYE